eukprot:m.259542 g.259542  ORF g.259542 m.259542 type:complete len:596 (+) comp40422_c0_seq21:437-2224(+)
MTMSYTAWTTNDICLWLDSINLRQYQSDFRRAGIVGAQMNYIDNNFLMTQLRITSTIQQREIKRALEDLTGAPAQSSTLFTGNRRTISDGRSEPLLSISAQALLRDNCRHSGWLRKQGAMRKSWRKRYHVVKNGCLYYFEEDTSAKAKGQFSLYSYEVQRSPEVTKFQWSFKLVHKKDLSKRIWYFAASSEHEMRTWMTKIEEDVADFCCPQVTPRPPSTLDQDNDEDEDAEDEEPCGVYDSPFDDSTPFDAAIGPPPPVAQRGRSCVARAPMKSPTSPSVPLGSPLLTISHSIPEERMQDSRRPVSPLRQDSSRPIPPPIRQDSRRQISPQNLLPIAPTNRGPPPLPPSQNQGKSVKANTTKQANSDSDSDSDSYLELVENETGGVSPKLKKNTSGLGRESTRKGLAGAIRMLPSLPQSEMPLKPGSRGQRKKVIPPQSSPDAVPKPKPIPKPRPVALVKAVPPALPPKQDDEDDVDEEPEDQYINPSDVNIVRDVVDVLPPSVFQSVKREKAEEMLHRRALDGLYLLRDSAHGVAEKVLTTWLSGKIKHYKVVHHDAGYSLQAGANFRSLRELIHFYSKNILPKTTSMLKRPY